MVLSFPSHFTTDYGYPHTVRVVLDLKEGVSYQRNISVTAGSGGGWR